MFHSLFSLVWRIQLQVPIDALLYYYSLDYEVFDNVCHILRYLCFVVKVRFTAAVEAMTVMTSLRIITAAVYRNSVDIVV